MEYASLTASNRPRLEGYTVGSVGYFGLSSDTASRLAITKFGCHIYRSTEPRQARSGCLFQDVVSTEEIHIGGTLRWTTVVRFTYLVILRRSGRLHSRPYTTTSPHIHHLTSGLPPNLADLHHARLQVHTHTYHTNRSALLISRPMRKKEESGPNRCRDELRGIGLGQRYCMDQN